MADISNERLEEPVHWSSNDGYGGMPDTHRALAELQRHRAAKAARAERLRVIAEQPDVPSVQLSEEELDAFEHIMRQGAAFAAIYPNGPDAVAAVAIRRLLAAHGAKP